MATSKHTNIALQRHGGMLSDHFASVRCRDETEDNLKLDKEQYGNIPDLKLQFKA